MRINEVIMPVNQEEDIISQAGDEFEEDKEEGEWARDDVTGEELVVEKVKEDDELFKV